MYRGYACESSERTDLFFGIFDGHKTALAPIPDPYHGPVHPLDRADALARDTGLVSVLAPSCGRRKYRKKDRFVRLTRTRIPDTYRVPLSRDGTGSHPENRRAGNKVTMTIHFWIVQSRGLSVGDNRHPDSGRHASHRRSLQSMTKQTNEAQHQTGEFDPGSERTFAAGLTHASRTRSPLRRVDSGARVRNTWVINPLVWDNQGKLWLIPDVVIGTPVLMTKDPQGLLEDEPAAHQLVGEVMAHQG